MSSPGVQYEEPPCACCGSDDHTVVVKSRRDPSVPIDVQTVFRSSGDEPLQDQMVRCQGCGLLYVRPRLTWDLILEGYKGGTDENFVSQVAFRELTFARCLDRIEKAAKPPGKRVLDVGAAGGSFLAEARKRGYEPLGCEPSTWMCGFAKQRYGLDLVAGTVFDMDVPKGSVHLLTLWDVLEHTPDPKAVLQRCHELLAPGGLLVVSVPDSGSLAAKLLGSRWPFLLTVHLYYFERPTLGGLMKRCGFEPLKFQPHLQTLEMGYVAFRAAPYLGPLGKLLTGTVKAIGMDKLPFHYWVGQTMAVARKTA